jgi:hypothetical protein
MDEIQKNYLLQTITKTLPGYELKPISKPVGNLYFLMYGPNYTTTFFVFVFISESGCVSRVELRRFSKNSPENREGEDETLGNLLGGCLDTDIMISTGTQRTREKVICYIDAKSSKMEKGGKKG